MPTEELVPFFFKHCGNLLESACNTKQKTQSLSVFQSFSQGSGPTDILLQILASERKEHWSPLDVEKTNRSQLFETKDVASTLRGFEKTWRG